VYPTTIAAPPVGGHQGYLCVNTLSTDQCCTTYIIISNWF